jgi:hypothetical protein
MGFGHRVIACAIRGRTSWREATLFYASDGDRDLYDLARRSISLRCVCFMSAT